MVAARNRAKVAMLLGFRLRDRGSTNLEVANVEIVTDLTTQCEVIAQLFKDHMALEQVKRKRKSIPGGRHEKSLRKFNRELKQGRRRRRRRRGRRLVKNEFIFYLRIS